MLSIIFDLIEINKIVELSIDFELTSGVSLRAFLVQVSCLGVIILL